MGLMIVGREFMIDRSLNRQVGRYIVWQIDQGSIFLLKVEFFSPPLKICVNFLPRRGKFFGAAGAIFFSFFPAK